MYTFEHTLNRYGNPDTLIIDPMLQYDMVVYTIPQIEKKGIVLKRNTHNVIQADCPQGFIKLRFTNATAPYQIPARVYKKSDNLTLNTQMIGTTDKYIVGTYEVELLTLPRIRKTVEITQSNTEMIDVAAPGQLQYSLSKNIVGQLFVLRDDGTIEWVCNLDPTTLKGFMHLQPGNYKIVYRMKHLRSTVYTTEKNFRIISNKTTPINL
jgi:Ca-activated chloride channel family protein